MGWLVVASVGAGCGAATGRAQFPVENIRVPDASEVYMAEARPDGVTGGPGADKVEADLVQVLRSRGAEPRADGALGAMACWVLREGHEGRQVDAISMDAASRYFGFGGVVVSAGMFGTNALDMLRENVETIPKNVPLTRYGICVSPAGHSAGVALGSMEATFETIPRAVDPGQSVRLKGSLTSRYKNGNLYVTNPDGTVTHKDVPGREFDENFLLDKAGVYRLEVMGNDSGGPAIVINVPIFVGVPEPVARGASGVVVDPEKAEPRFLVLLNEARAKAGLRPLNPDADLVAIARSHSEDMADHRFFAHVSPSTGTPDDRARRAKLLVSRFGENIGIGPTPEDVHEGLMGSPGHRMNMLTPEYTHVGIAAEKGDGALVVTMNFARRLDPATIPKSAAEVEKALGDLRSQRGLKPYQPDPVYRGAAQSGADVLARGAEDDEVNEAIQSGLAREAERLRESRPAGCSVPVELLELSQLTTIPHLLSPALGRLGVGARLAEDKRGKRLSTVFMLDGPACRP